MKKFLDKKGFTLIELLVTIGIIGILSGLLLANFIGVRQRSRDGVRKSDLRQIQAALELYRSDQGNYPATDAFPGCGASLVDNPSSATPVVYMREIPCDPSGGTAVYTYSYSDATKTYSLIACLENENDSQRDLAAETDEACVATTNISYILRSP